MRPRKSRKYQYGKNVPIYAEVVFWGKNGGMEECGIYGKVFAFVEIDQTLQKEIKIFQSCFSPGILCVSVCSINSRIVRNLPLIINQDTSESSSVIANMSV